MTDVFTPRVGSNVDIAWKLLVTLRVPSWNVTAGYNYIGPGYRSLGIGSLLVDREELLGRIGYARGRVTANVAASSLGDNVLGQKVSTTTRNSLIATTGFRVSRNLFLTIRGGSNTMVRDAETEDKRIDYTNRSFGSGARMTIRGTYLRSAGIDYRVQRAHDPNPARLVDLTVHQLLVPVGLQFGRAIRVTPHVGLVYLDHPVDGSRVTHTEKLAVRHSLPGRRMTTTVVAGTSFSDGSRRLTATATSAYRIGTSATVKLVLRQNAYRPGEEELGLRDVDNSQEFVVRLSLVYDV